MESRVTERPHTVGSVFNHNMYSECIMKILEDIEAEATSPPSKPKIQEKNYLKENFKRLKEIQAKAKERAKEKKPLQPIKAVNKYNEVQSKIPDSALHNKNSFIRNRGNHILPKTAGPYRTQPPGSPYSGCRSASHLSLHKCKSLPQLSQAQENKLPVCSTGKSERSPDDMLKETHQKNKQLPESKSEVKHRLGHIPNYLTERKKQWEKDRQRQLKEIEEAAIPLGHTLLPDEERLETLELLKKNQEELLCSLASLPVRNDTLRLRLYKEELERQLAKVEEGIKIFSRPKVLIKNDT